MTYKETAKKHQAETIKFLKKLRFKHVDGGDQFFIGGRQVDACGGHEKTLLIIECTTQKDINAKINSFRGKLRDIIHAFKREPKYRAYERYVTILAVKYQKVTQTHVNHALKSKGRKVYIWSNAFVSYYSKLRATVGEFAKYSLLADIGVKPEHIEEVTIPAFCTRAGAKGRYLLFLFFIEAQHLLKFAYVARRELGYESFYQRMVKRERLTTIASKYIEKGKVFPNSIVVGLDQGGWDFEAVPEKVLKRSDFTAPNWLTLVKLKLINNYRSCWIIDGQHRLYSYAHTSVPGILAVSAFGRIQKGIQADYFLDINREAKPVDPNLLWDLLGLRSPNSARGIISNAIKDLRQIGSGFFADNIKIPSLGNGQFGFNNLCTSVEKTSLAKQELARRYATVRNPFYDKDHTKFARNISLALNQYFSCFDERIQKERRKLLYSDGFVSVMVSLFGLLATHLGKRPSTQEEVAFFAPIWDLITSYKQEDIEGLRRFLTSEGNKRDFRDDLILRLQEAYDKDFAVGLVERGEPLAEKIGKLEFQLNEFVNSTLTNDLGSDWMNNAQYFPDGGQRKQCFERAKKYDKPAWEYINFLTTINSVILNNQLWGRFFKDIFISKDGFHTREELKSLAERLWDYRSNKRFHTRSSPIGYRKDTESLIQAAYKIFLLVIESNTPA